MASYLVGAGGGTVTLTNDNLTASIVGMTAAAVSNTKKSTGKWCYEITVDNQGTSFFGVCMQNASIDPSYAYNTANSLTIWSTMNTKYPGGAAWDGGKVTNNGDKVMIAVDVDNKKMMYRVNGGSWSSYNYWTFANPVEVFICNQSTTGATTINFGATSFSSDMPDGFLPWDTEPVSGSYYRQII